MPKVWKNHQRPPHPKRYYHVKYHNRRSHYPDSGVDQIRITIVHVCDDDNLGVCDLSGFEYDKESSFA